MPCISSTSALKAVTTVPVYIGIIYCPSMQVPPSPGQHRLDKVISTKALFFSTSFKQRTSKINTLDVPAQPVPTGERCCTLSFPIFSHFFPPEGTHNTEVVQCKATVFTLGMCMLWGKVEPIFVLCYTIILSISKCCLCQELGTVSGKSRCTMITGVR